LLPRQYNCGNEKNKEVGWTELKDEGVVVSWTKTKDREMHCSRILQPQQKLTVLSQATRYKPVKTSLLQFTSIRLEVRKISRRNVLSTACSATVLLVDPKDNEVRLLDRKEKVIQ